MNCLSEKHKRLERAHCLPIWNVQAVGERETENRCLQCEEIKRICQASGEYSKQTPILTQGEVQEGFLDERA